MTGKEWVNVTRSEEWALFRAHMPHAHEGEALLIEEIVPDSITRVLDLGTGDGHLIALIHGTYPRVDAVGLDISPHLVDNARERFSNHAHVSFAVHDLMNPLPRGLGQFDLVISGLAIHHLPDNRKRDLYYEAYEHLTINGVFCDFDVSASPTPALHRRSHAALGLDERGGDPSDQPARLEDRLDWLRTAGFVDVDCFWKWLDLALVGGTRYR